MHLHVAQFRALALKNFSLQLKRKGSTACQIIIPLVLALCVGIIQVVTNFSEVNPYYYSYPYYTVPGIERYYNNISYSGPTDPQSVPVGFLSPNKRTDSYGPLSYSPQLFFTYTPYYYNQKNISVWSPFTGPQFPNPEAANDYFYQQSKAYSECGYSSNCYMDYYWTSDACLNFNKLRLSDAAIDLDYNVQQGGNANLGTYYNGVNSPSWYMTFVHNSILRSILKTNTTLFVSGIRRMPDVDYGNPGAAGNLFALFMIPFGLSFLFSVYMYTLVQEKKEGLVQKMHTCGLPMATYWVVNYIYNYFLYAIIATAMYVSCVAFGVTVFTKKPFELILLIFLYGHAQVAMCQFFTCFMWTPTLAFIVGFLLSIFGTFGGMALEVFVFLTNPYKMPNGFFFIYPGFTFYHGFGLLINNLLDPTFPSVDLVPGKHFSSILLILLAQTVIFSLLTWYTEAVFPREIGIRRNPFFPFIYLFKKMREWRNPEYEVILTAEKGNINLLPLDGNGDLPYAEDDDVARERELVSKSDALVKIMDLTKIYPSANGQPAKKALNHVSFRIQPNECFGLLGPNGAGKTTLLSTLCGSITPSGGTAFIDDLNIRKDMEEIHKILGICPQFDVLWNELTVQEHLLFYLRLKNVQPISREMDAVKEIIEEVGLEEVENRQATGLSGGQKRRLSIAIAMMGRPKLILMDEPTTGLDPSSRRALWDIIVKAKEKHSIVLSTHSMEEAEVLCNRIGIMRKARLHSVGTQMHLKNKFELGYNVKVSHFLNCDDKAHTFVMENIPNAVLVRAFGGIRAYKVMKDDFVLSELFKKMELNKYRWGIKEWSISQASLEEVFLAIVTEDESDNL